MIIEVRVVPNAKNFSLKQEGGTFVARIPAKPVDGEANKELEKQLKKLLGKKVVVVSGFKNRVKKVFMDAGKEEKDTTSRLKTSCTQK